jgi:spore germination cell wall hydrolase CwlJ-like protein
MIKVIKSIFSKYAITLVYTAAVMGLIAFIAFSWQTPVTAENEQALVENEQALVENEQFVADKPQDEKNETVILSKFKAKEINCLAKNIYFEARSSNLADKAAVADVVMNRVQDRRYPSTICSVISQGIKPNRKDCQFSWKCDGKSEIPRESDSWDEAKTIAYNMYIKNKYRGITEGATHYHATYVKPYWAKSLQAVGRIGEHIYYRWE